MDVRSNEAYFLHSVQLNYLTQFHHLKCHVYYFASKSHRQRCIADGAIKETDWTPALAKSARRQSDWSCSRLALHILRGARCREHSADPESRSRSDATSAQPSRCRRRHHPLTRESRHGVAQAREREIACFKRFRQPLFHQRKYLSDYIWTIRFITALSILLHREHRKKRSM